MHVLTRHDSQALRHFGLGLGGLVALIFWGLLPWIWGHARPTWPPAAGAVLSVAAVVWPVAIYPCTDCCCQFRNRLGSPG